MLRKFKTYFTHSYIKKRETHPKYNRKRKLRIFFRFSDIKNKTQNTLSYTSPGRCYHTNVTILQYHRTKETAQPTATKNNLDIIIYDPRVIDDTEAFLMETKGKTVLVVGHSNTTPAFVNAILGEKKHENIDDDNNGNLYIVTIIDRKVTDTVLTIN